MWTKIINVLDAINIQEVLYQTEVYTDMTSIQIQTIFTNFTEKYLNDYPVKWSTTMETVNTALASITDFPDEFWPQWVEYIKTKGASAIDEENLDSWIFVFSSIANSIENSVMGSYDVDLMQEWNEDQKKSTNQTIDVDLVNSGLEIDINTRAWERYLLVVSI
jgi:hypothetical protein